MILNSKMLWNGRSVFLVTCKYANEYRVENAGQCRLSNIENDVLPSGLDYIIIGADSGTVGETYNNSSGNDLNRLGQTDGK